MATVRKLTSTCLSLLVFALSENLYAIGLGEIHLHSHLNEPLLAEIILEDAQALDPSDLVIKAGEPGDFEKIGLEPPPWLSEIQFVITKHQTSQLPIIVLKTQEPIKDPYTNIVVSLSWPEGKLLREYTILLDPPPLKSKLSSGDKLTLSNPLPTALKKKPVSLTQENSDVVLGGTYGPVYEETLWSIAKKLVKPTAYSIYQGVMAIAYKNPNAFVQGNIHSIKKGTILKLPNQEEIAQFSQPQAQRFVLNSDPQELAALTQLTENSTPISSADNNSLTQADVDKRLKLLAPLSQPEQENKEAASFGANPAMSERLMMIEEAIDTLKRSNEDMTQKNQSLLQQNESLSSLLAQKEAEINRLKQAMQTQDAQAPAEPTVAGTAPTENYAIAKTDPQPSTEPVLGQQAQSAATSMPKQPATPAPIVAPTAPIVPSVTPQAVTEPTPSSEVGAKDQAADNTMLFLLFTLVLGGALAGWLWFSRERLFALLSTWTKNSDLEGRSTFVARRESLTNQEINFNLDKALAAVIEEEKRFLLPRRPAKEKSEEKVKELHSSLEEVELYIAYERYAEAEKLLKDLLTQYPQNGEIFLKLLEIYVLTQRYDEFKHWHALVPENIKENSPSVWSKINHLYEKVKNEKVVEFRSNSKSEKPASLQVPLSDDIKKSPLPFTETPPFKDELHLKEASVDDNSDPEGQLSLAQAFIEIGDWEAARELLVKVSSHGNPEQIKQAEILLERIDKPL